MIDLKLAMKRNPGICLFTIITVGTAAFMVAVWIIGSFIEIMGINVYQSWTQLATDGLIASLVLAIIYLWINLHST